MTIYVHRQGERFDISRVFTAVEGVETLADLSDTRCIQQSPNGAQYEVELDITIDNAADPPTATCLGSFLVPRAHVVSGMWTERWDTGPDLEDAADQPWWCTSSPVVAMDDSI